MSIVAGAPQTSADIAAIQALTTGRPLGRLIASGTQSIPTGAQTAITFTGSEDIDTHGYHNPASNASRFTPLIAGIYRVSGFVHMSNAVNAAFEVYPGKNGVMQAGGDRDGTPGSATNRGQYGEALLSCNGGGDYFELMVFQASGGAWATNQSGRYSSVFEIEFMRL